MAELRISKASALRLAALRKRAESAREIHDTYIRGVLEGNGYEDVRLSDVSINFHDCVITIKEIEQE